MCQYHRIVNLTQRVSMSPSAVGSDVKLMEFGQDCSGAMSALVLLLGSEAWAGDRVAIVGDYGEPEDLPLEARQETGLDGEAYGDDRLQELEEPVRELLEQRLGARFTVERIEHRDLDGYCTHFEFVRQEKAPDPEPHGTDVVIVNVDLGEVLDPAAFGQSRDLHLMAVDGGWGGVTTALAVLLAAANRGGPRGGGDLPSADPHRFLGRAPDHGDATGPLSPGMPRHLRGHPPGPRGRRGGPIPGPGRRPGRAPGTALGNPDGARSSDELRPQRGRLTPPVRGQPTPPRGEVEESFTDYASGKNREDRPKLAALMRHARRGDTVRVASMDRLARSAIELAELVSALTGRGITVEFITERLIFRPDDEDPFATFQLQMLGAVAQLERSMIGERQREGIALARARGVYQGRKRRLTDDQVQDARDQIASGIPKAAVARTLGCSRRVLYDALAGQGAYAQ